MDQEYDTLQLPSAADAIAPIGSVASVAIDGDQFGCVECALDKTGWQQQDIAAGSCPPG